LVGQVVAGRFEVEAMLGAGGMGAVYRARQLSVDRQVALKVLKRDILDDQQAVRRFFLEAKATSRLSNPHTVTVHDFGQTDEGLLFIAMEYLDGQDLRERLRASGHLPASEAVSVIEAVAESLAEAHEMEIIHRDLKPENIFLVRRGKTDAFVKVLDFGIARAQALTGDKGLTATGSIAGTPAYMSPEMVRGEKVEASADVYAMGVLLYEMISGRQPIDGATPFMVMQRHLTQTPSPLHEELDLSVVPKLLSIFVQRCLEKDPTLRPQNAAQFRTELLRAYEGTPTQPSLSVPKFTGVAHTTSEVALLQTQRASSEQIRAITDAGVHATAAKLQPLNAAYRADAVDGPARQRSPGRVVAAIAAALCVAVGGYLALSGAEQGTQVSATHGSKSASEAQQATAAVTPDPISMKMTNAGTRAENIAPALVAQEKPTPPAEVSISVTSTPPGAEIRMDDKVVGKTPTMLKIPRGEDAATMTLNLEGHVPRELMFLPSEDRLMTATLNLLPKAAAPAAKRKAPNKRRPTPKAKTRASAKKASPKPAAKKASPKPTGKKRFNVLFDD
jgi:tRNA A-37 threonylcarbamoyl transferase component Bud32